MEFVGELMVITLQLKAACRLEAKLKSLKQIYLSLLLQSPLHFELVSHCSEKRERGKFGNRGIKCIG